jgi:glycosyltransferase involved in cell wall biosynthesis
MARVCSRYRIKTASAPSPISGIFTFTERCTWPGLSVDESCEANGYADLGRCTGNARSPIARASYRKRSGDFLCNRANHSDTHRGGRSAHIYILGKNPSQKGFKAGYKAVAMLRVHQPGARYLIIGPDGGDLSDVQSLVADLELTDAVEFYGPKDFSDIRKIAVSGSFYLQTSEMEGMAMSVVEAMQLGLVPVVTPVGESARYCRDGYNAIVVRDDTEAVAAVLQLLDNVERFQTLRTNAMAIWRDKALYKDDVIQACHEVLKV